MKIFEIIFRDGISRIMFGETRLQLRKKLAGLSIAEINRIFIN
jgi:hypothetical protein